MSVAPSSPASPRCIVYKSTRLTETYLYVPEQDRLSRVPRPLLERLGALEPVMTLDLGARRRLARADVARVRRRLREAGYYLQLPPRPEAIDPS